MPRGVGGTTLRSSLRIRNSLENGGGLIGDKKEPTANVVALKRKAPEATKSKNAKRTAFVDITNAENDKNKSTANLKSTVKKGLTNIRSSFGSKKSSSRKSSTVVAAAAKSLPPKKQFVVLSSSFKEEDSDLSLSHGSLPPPSSSFPTSSQEIKSEVDECDDEDSKSILADVSKKEIVECLPEGVTDFDNENWNDPNQCSFYAMDIFRYYKSRESMFAVKDYIKSGRHPEVTLSMRSVLVDWLVEVQESFELNHETLYTAVKIFDSYMSTETAPIKRDDLQLIGATACLIACKIDERLPPLLDDFVYVCDDAYTREQIIKMERKMIISVDFDFGFPLSYRFLRRYGRVCKITMPVLTLARYILEMSLMEYEFNVGTSESKLAAAALVLALKIRGLDGWLDTLKYYSGFSPAVDLKDLVNKLLALVSQPESPNLKTIRQKYSHVVFHEVALTKLPKQVAVFEI